MKNKVKLIVNPFIRIAGGQSVDMGLSGLNSISPYCVGYRVIIIMVCLFWTGPQSGLVVLSGRTSDCVADSCTALFI